MQHHREGRNASVDVGFQVERATRFRNPFRRRDKELPLVLAFKQHQAVQPDVVDKDSVRHIAAGIFFAKLHQASVIQPFHLQIRASRFTGIHSQLGRMLKQARSLLF